MNQRPILVRPVTTTLITFFGLTGLVVTTAPFMGFIHPIGLTLLGLGCSLFLSVFTVGVLLAAGSRLFRSWMITGILPLSGVFAFWAWLRQAPEFVLSDRLPLILRILLFVIPVWIGFGGAVSAFGWARFFRQRRAGQPRPPVWSGTADDTGQAPRPSAISSNGPRHYSGQRGPEHGHVVADCSERAARQTKCPGRAQRPGHIRDR